VAQMVKIGMEFGNCNPNDFF